MARRIKVLGRISEWHQDRKWNVKIFGWELLQRRVPEQLDPWQRYGYIYLGEYVWSENRKYEGDWQHNKMHGYGKLEWADGRMY